jgi:hypothetical protein
MLVLLLVCAGLEIVTRTVLFPRSRDFVRFAGYPERAAKLVRQDGLRIAFIGNSATQRGFNPTQFVAELPNPQRCPVHVDLFVADGSQLNTWHYLVKQAFWRQDLNPDWFVVTFFGTSLEDGDPIEIGRLAQFFTQPDDWPEVCATDLTTLSDRADFLLSTTWATFAARDRIRKRVLAAVVPEYKDFAEALHAAQHRHPKPPSTPPARTCKALERFLAAAQQHGNRVCFVAFPTRDCGEHTRYPINPEVERRITGAGMVLLDLRRVPGLRAEDYEDDYHLTPAGAALYTRAFTQASAPMFGAIRAARAYHGKGAIVNRE